MKLKHSILMTGFLLATQGASSAANITVSSDITSNTTWTKNNTYILDKSVFVKNNATLTIQPGTMILGTRNATNDTYGSLVISRNGKIQAIGTADEPIVMTAKQEADGVKLDPAAGDGGFWGGLIILGKAPINFFTGPTTNANENEIEGFPSGSTEDIKYGGNSSKHNSGTLKYVSIRFGGYVYAVGKEINGLTMGGVGSGTTIENVEVISNTDDGVEIFGGTVNTKRIAVAFCQDDCFDLDEGHQGFHQFWFTLQNADGSLGDRGGEWDGANGATKDGLPRTNARIFNATFIGDGKNTGGDNNAFFLDDNFAGELNNSVAHDFSGSAVVESGDGLGKNSAFFKNTTFGAFGSAGNDYGILNSVSTNITKTSAPGFIGISRSPNGGLDPRPSTGSALLTDSRSAFPSDAPAGFYEAANYRGAFGETNWLDGWSYLSKKGYLGDSDGAPVFSLQPKSKVIATGKRVVIRAKATAKAATKYQWYKNGVALKGKTSPILILNKFNRKKAGRYYVKATSNGLSTKSRVAKLDFPRIINGKLTKATKLKKGKRVRFMVKTNFKASRFEASGLPKGMKIDKSGQISGKPAKKGRFKVTITAKKKLGSKLKYKTTIKKTFKVS